MVEEALGAETLILTRMTWMMLLRPLMLSQVQFAKIKRILDKHSIESFDLLPFLKEDLIGFTPKYLRVSEKDNHPNFIVTKIYAKYVYKYVIEEVIPIEFKKKSL